MSPLQKFLLKMGLRTAEPAAADDAAKVYLEYMPAEKTDETDKALEMRHSQRRGGI